MTDDRFGSGADEVLRALLSSIADAVYAVDADGAVRFVNPAAARMLGYADDERALLGRPSHATIHHSRPDGTPYPEDECPLLAPRVTGEAVRVDEDWFVRRDGSMVPVAYSSAPIETSAGRGAIVVFQDITERREKEAARRREAAERARSAALHASRARIVEAHFDERRRLSRDLHDGAQQRLVNVVIALQLALRDTGVGGPGSEAYRSLDTALAETRAAVDDLRELAAGLLPSVLTHRGLAGAIESLAGRAPLPVALELSDARFPPALEATAYFVVAEALTNVAKHAGATEATISLTSDATNLVVTVTDDGRGGAARADGRGLAGLEDRVAAVDGTLELTSPPGAGTALTVTLPLSAPAAP